MKTKKQKKREIAYQLAMQLRAYNAVASPPDWRGDEEIDAVYSALTSRERELDVALERLMHAAETVQEGNRYTEDVRRVLTQAKALYSHHHFMHEYIDIILESFHVKKTIRDTKGSERRGETKESTFIRKTFPLPCSQWAEQLIGLLPESLSDFERSVLEKHLASCSVCATVFHEYRILNEDMHRSLTAHPLPNLKQER